MFTRIAVGLLAVGLVTELPAQVPLGHYVVTSFWVEPLARRPGGIFVVDPRQTGVAVPLTGLAPELVGQALQGYTGASAVAVRTEDGSIVAGETVPNGSTVHLHDMRLVGSAVVSDLATTVGTAGLGASAGIAEVELMPNGDTLVAVQDLVNAPPLNGAVLGIVTRSGQVVPVPTQILQAPYPQALAVSPDGSTAYLVVAPIQPHAVHLYAVPLPAGGTAQLVGTFGWNITALAFDPNGDLLACTSTHVLRVDVATGTLAPLAPVAPGTVALAVEDATREWVTVANQYGTTPATGVYHQPPLGAFTLLTSGLPGVLSDVAVLPNPQKYGVGSPGAASFDWQVAPAPGGLPQAGNLGFALEVDANGASPGGGFVFASLGEAALPVQGVTALIDPFAAVFVGLTDAAGRLPLPLPITAPIDLLVFAQSFHLDTGAPAGLAATPGQRFRIMP